LVCQRIILDKNYGSSTDKLCHPRSDAYSEQQVLLNKQQIWCGWADLDCYQNYFPRITENEAFPNKHNNASVYILYNFYITVSE